MEKPGVFPNPTGKNALMIKVPEKEILESLFGGSSREASYSYILD